MSTPAKEELFRATSLSTGQSFVIYTNGQCDGFPEDVYIVNRYPLLRAKQKALLTRQIEERKTLEIEPNERSKQGS